MPSTGIFDGKSIGIYVGGTLVSHSTNATFDIQMDEREITTKDTSGNFREYKPTRGSATITGTFYRAEDATEGYEELFDDIIAGTEATVKVSTAVTGDVEYSATGWINALSTSAADSENASIDVTWRLSGTISKATI